MISKFRKFLVAIAAILCTMGAVTGGMMAGAEHVSGISTTQMQGFSQQVQGNAIKFAVNSAARLAFGEKPKDVLKSGGANFVADVGAGMLSNEISGWRQDTIGNGSLFDYNLHKTLHFATGAITRGGAEALMGGNSSAIHRAALSGGAGAATAEIMGEALALDALRSGRMHQSNTTEMMGHITTLSSQTTGLGAALTGLDVSHAQHAGSVAVENNTAQLAFILAARSAKVAGDMANEDDGDVAAEAGEQWYGQKREAVLEAVTPEVAHEFAESAADYSQLMQGGPEAYANARLQGIQDPRVREQLRSEYESDYFEDQHAFSMMAGIGLATEAAGKVIEFGARVLGADRGTARNIRHGVDDATLVSGGIGLGLAKTGAKLSARTAGKVGRAGVKAGPGRISKEQPWTVRDGQEWKEKVVGRAQKTGTDGHSFRSYREAIKAAKQEDVDKVLLNRGVNRVLDEKIRPNRRPDVTVVRKSGRIDQVEVPSRTDDVDLLRKRMNDTSNYFPRSRVGKNDIKDISGGAKK
jgi:hypothetical protein